MSEETRIELLEMEEKLYMLAYYTDGEFTEDEKHNLMKAWASVYLALGKEL